MTFQAPPPPVPDDPKAIHALADRNHQDTLGLTQDIAHIGGWIWAVVGWPFRLIARVVRG